MRNYAYSVKEGLKESNRLFRNAQKQDRELYFFANSFPIFRNRSKNLKYLHLRKSRMMFFTENMASSQKKYYPTAERGKKYSNKLEETSKNTSPEDILEPYTPTHIPLNQALPR